MIGSGGKKKTKLLVTTPQADTTPEEIKKHGEEEERRVGGTIPRNLRFGKPKASKLDHPEENNSTSQKLDRKDKTEKSQVR